MRVSIKDFSVAMEVKNAGLELDVYSPDGKTHYGDLVVTKTGLIWCPRRRHRKNGIKLSWLDFIAMVQTDKVIALPELVEVTEEPLKIGYDGDKTEV